MKYLPCFLLSIGTVLGASIGDTYQQVIAEKGNPRSQISAGTVRVLNYPDETIKIRDNGVVSISRIAAASEQHGTPPSAEVQPATLQGRIAAVKREQDQAILRVRAIVNQPVTALDATPQMKAVMFSPGWFHAGASKPDFNTVDVRATQELQYDRYEYVCSDLNPAAAFVGRELEFNPMTKYFYTDRSVPKKKLTETEMLEINRLYRIIGRCEQQLVQLQAP